MIYNLNCAADAGAVNKGMICGNSIVADGAGGSMRAVAVVYIGVAVAKGCDSLLRNDGYAADGAVRAFRQAGLGAGRSNGCVGDLGVTRCGNYPTIFGNLSFTG